MINQLTFANGHILTQIGHSQLFAYDFVCLYILIHNRSVRVSREWREGTGYRFQQYLRDVVFSGHGQSLTCS